MTGEFHRRLPIGAEALPQAGVHFRVWAPVRKKVEVLINSESENPITIEMDREPDGYFSCTAPDVRAGALYRYRLDGKDAYPDPASRFQPSGPHGPSRVIDPASFQWTDNKWPGISLDGQIIYEMHIGTFTREGTFASAAKEFPELAELGITVIEVMPVADFTGNFGWGYDGVCLFAPTRLYGEPDDFRRFVDTAHAHGLGVILDVVYNHLGPDGNYLKQFSPAYFSGKHKTDWGEAINYDGESSGPVREFFSCNAAYWIDEFDFDGLRFDATTQIFDDSSEHILAVMSRKARAAAGGRSIILVAEHESQHVKLVKPRDHGGYGMDAVWNDDFHHTAVVALTGDKSAYYTDYHGNPQEFISSVKYGYLFQGQYYKWQKKRRGTPTFGLKPSVFITYLDNHDQIANSAKGLRCHMRTSPGSYRAMTALILLGPGTSMLFQGQEFASSSRFLYFADHKPELAELVHKGRGEFLAQFPDIATAEGRSLLANPADPETFKQCILDFSERETHKEIYKMHRDLIRLRKGEPVFRSQRLGGVDGAVLGLEAFVLRFFSEDKRDLLLVVNLGPDLHFDPAPEPLLAPPEMMQWQILWSSDHPDYGGTGTPPLETEENWRIPGHAAVVLFPKEQSLNND
jgi:maltooligosyltrehalose trehalohydrolase